MFSKRRPTNLGVNNGRLADCPNRANCVSSQADDADHYIEPLDLGTDPIYSMEMLKIFIAGMDGVTIIKCNKDYIYAECKTSVLGFTDDLEVLWCPADRVCHVRSASRIGFSDLGVNRKRVEKIRLYVESLIDVTHEDMVL